MGPNVGMENIFNMSLEVVIKSGNIMGNIVQKGNKVFNDSSEC